MRYNGSNGNLQIAFLISLVLLMFFNIASAKAELCRIDIHKEQKTADRVVFLSGGKAWNLFQTYLKELENNNIKVSLRKISVYVWDGKELKEFSLGWRDYLTGQSAKERWEGRLKNVDALPDEASLKNAVSQKWDIICISSDSGPSIPKKESAQTVQIPPKSEKAADSIPVEAQLNLQQGLNYVKLRDYDNAINEFTRAIEKSPNYAAAYTNRAVAYMQQKKYNKAMDDLKKASEVAPGDPMVYYNFTALYSLQNQLDRSLDSLDRALELGFKDYDSLRKDPDLNNVRKHPEFRKILEKYKVFI